MLTLGMITFDTHDALELSSWWAGQLEGEVVEENDGYFCIVKTPLLPVPLAFQLVEEPAAGKNRIHLDLAATEAAGGREPVVARLVSGGASLVDQQRMEGFAWDVLSDPHGNVFCVSDPH
ncbi:VOC family protein [Paeniglutamicibacter sp. R2-26]|uniref:VOC family protein n=1 Tax=Paeniglutamicibacter sp. R2-26 TaxID=3144417 RepID=UPI003EE43F88